MNKLKIALLAGMLSLTGVMTTGCGKEQALPEAEQPCNDGEQAIDPDTGEAAQCVGGHWEAM
jgi:hypothetical protein